MPMRLNPFSRRPWTPTGFELGDSAEVPDGTVRLPRRQLPEELRQHSELMVAVEALPDANSLILGIRDSDSNLAAAMVPPSAWSELVPPDAAELLEGPPLLRVRPLSLPERARRLAGLSGAIVAAAVLSAVLTAVPLLLPEPDATAKRAEATLVETSEVSAALTALGSRTSEVDSAVERAGTAAVAGQAHARNLRRRLDRLGTGTTGSDPAVLRKVPALRESADALLRDNQEALDASRAAADGVAGLRSSSAEITAWRDSLQRRVQPAPAPWRATGSGPLPVS